VKLDKRSRANASNTWLAGKVADCSAADLHGTVENNHLCPLVHRASSAGKSQINKPAVDDGSLVPVVAVDIYRQFGSKSKSADPKVAKCGCFLNKLDS
jgi:hypothetical protein